MMETTTHETMMALRWGHRLYRHVAARKLAQIETTVNGIKCRTEQGTFDKEDAMLLLRIGRIAIHGDYTQADRLLLAFGFNEKT